MNNILVLVNEVLLVLAFIIGTSLYNKKLNIIKKENEVKAKNVENRVKYDEAEIIKHLDFIIDEALEEYIINEFGFNDTTYISTKEENKIIDYLKDTIPERISDNLYNKLTYIYSENYIGEFLGKKIYYKVVEVVVNNNVRE